jgi:hypothetical protein
MLAPILHKWRAFARPLATNEKLAASYGSDCVLNTFQAVAATFAVALEYAAR